MPTSSAGGLVIVTGTHFGVNPMAIARDKNLFEVQLSTFEGDTMRANQLCVRVNPGVGSMAFSIIIKNTEKNLLSGEYPISYPKPRILCIEIADTDCRRTQQGMIMLPSSGKARLKIQGENFGNNLHLVKVSIGAFPCRVLRMLEQHTELLIETPAGTWAYMRIAHVPVICFHTLVALKYKQSRNLKTQVMEAI